VRASFVPTRELITLDFPTFDRPRKAISGTPGEGKCVKSLAESMNRARIRIPIVSSVWVVHGKRRDRKKIWRERFWARNKSLEPERTFRLDVLLLDRMQSVPEREATCDDESDENTDEKEPAIRREHDQQNSYYTGRNE